MVSRASRYRGRRRTVAALVAVMGLSIAGVVPAAASDASVGASTSTSAAASATLGASPQWVGMAGNPGDGTSAVSSSATTKDGRECWSTATTPVRNDFLYFRVDDDHKPDPGGYAFVTVDYYDAGGGDFTVQYDGPSGTVSSDVVPLTGSKSWKSYTFQLADVEFAGDLPTGADFRVASWDSRFGRSSTDVCVSAVAVSFAADAALTLAPTDLVFSGDEQRTVPFASSAAAVDWTASDEQGVERAAGTASSSTGSIDLSSLPLGYYDVRVTATTPAATLERTLPIALLAARPSAKATASSPFGVNVHVSKGNPSTIWDPLDEVGFSRVRDSIRWEYVEKTQGVYSLPSWGTSLVQQAAAHHVDLSLTLALTNKLYDDNKTPSSPEGIAAFANYASALLDLTKTNRVEVYNEFDGSFNNGTCGKTADCYLPLLKATATQVKQDHPDAVVVGPAGGSSGFWDRLFELGGLGYLDEVSPHLYGFPAPPEQSGMTGVSALDTLIKEHNDGVAKPISVTENGYPTHTPGGVTTEQQGDQLVRGIALGLSEGMTSYYYYDFLDDGMNPAAQEQNFGLMRPAGYLGLPVLSPKPALVTQAVMIRQLVGMTYAGTDDLGDDAHSVRFEGGDAPVRVMWSTTPSTVRMRTTHALKVVDAYGEQTTVQPSGGYVELALGEHPIYVKGEVRSPALVASPVYQMSVPATVAQGETVDATFTVDRTHGESAPEWVNFRVDGKRVAVHSTSGKAVSATVTLPAVDEVGNHTVSATAGAGSTATAHLAADVSVVRPLSVSASPVVTSTSPFGAALDVTVRNNSAKSAADPGEIVWTVGAASGEVTQLGEIDAGGTVTRRIVVPDVQPWASYSYTVSVQGGTAVAAVSGSTGFDPVTPEGATSDDAVPPIDLVADGKVDYRHQTYGGDSDLSGTVKLSWTDTGLVVKANVEDNLFSNVQQGNAGWNGDAIQLAVTPTLPGASTQRVEILAALESDGPTLLALSAAPGQVAGEIPGVRCRSPGPAPRPRTS
ncbi:hypothetical protein GCM10025864_14260 [Luteimicrobium album]|uniref:Uncharacterized protein n=2 Tax=Luteimicrobium album TaxID=1054550 RepID=A0ABQ6HZ40_9MICO|nr:hypothetical protein GCM10025864_14260 [Luteimicrobium album]